MTLKKVAKKVTPEYTYYAYMRMDQDKTKYFWRNPYNQELIPITSKALKTWESINEK